MVTSLFNDCQLSSGGLNLAKSFLQSDICVDGMILHYALYFTSDEKCIERLVDPLLFNMKPDGEFTWNTDRENGDLDTTICFAEGLRSYLAHVKEDSDR